MTVAVMVTFVVLLMGSGIFAYLLRDQPNAVTPTSSTGAVAAPAGSDNQAQNRIPLLGELFGPGRFRTLAVKFRQLGSDLGANRAALFTRCVSRVAARVSSATRSTQPIRRADSDSDGSGGGRDDDGGWRQRRARLRNFCRGLAGAFPHEHSRPERKTYIYR